MKRVVLLFLLLLALPLHSFTPYSHIDAASTVTTPATSTEGLGPSVDLSYQPLSRVWSRERMGYVRHQDIGYFGWDNSRSYMLDNDGDYYQWYQKPNSSDGVAEFDVIILFELDSPYTDLNQLSYDLRYDVSGGSVTIDTGGLDLFTATGKTTVELTNQGTDYTSTLSLNSSYVVSERINGRIWVSIDGSGMVDLTIKFDQMRFEYNTVSETRRSEYEVAGGTIRYTVSWDTWAYNVNTTLTVPSAWTFRDVNPDCGVTSDEFECLVPKTYSAIYTCDVTATANWEPYWSTSFENGETFTSHPSYPIDTQTAEYTKVLDGSASLYANDSTTTYPRLSEVSVLPDGKYIMVFSIYLVSGSGSTSYNFLQYWKTSQFYSTVFPNTMTTGKWVTQLISFEVIGNVSSGGLRNWQFYLYGAREYYIDNLIIYQSNVVTGSTVTGTTHYVHPNGYLGAGNFTMEYYCSTWKAAWTEYYTDSDGSWSISTSGWSLAAGTETFQTRNPDDTTNDVTSDNITYPFSVSVSTTLWMVFKRGTGQLIPWGTFICYVDDEIRPEPYAEITGTTTTGTSYTVNVTLADDFGQILYQNTSYPVENSGNTFFRETLNVYILNLANQRNRLQYAIVTRDGETWTSPDIGVYGSFPYLVYGSVAGITYTVDWYRAHDDHLTDSLTWTVYTSDVTAYSGYDPPAEPPGGVTGDLPDFWKIMIIFIAVIAVLSLVVTLLKGGKKETVYVSSQPPTEGGEDLDFSKLTPEDEVNAEIRAQLELRRKIEKERKGGDS